MTYVVLISACLAIAMAWGCSPPAADRPGDGTSEAGPPPLPEIARLAGQGRLDGVTIEYWVGGGAPPPFYRSDQFRLLTVEDSDVLEFARPYHDPADKREGLIEKFRAPAHPSNVRALAKLILDAGVFTRHYPDENDPGRADILNTEVIVRAGGREYKRRYFTASPKPLEPLRAEVERLVQRLTASGKRGIFFQGKPVASSPEPAEENAGRAEATTDTIPLSQLVEEVGRRIDRRLSAQGKLALWLKVGDTYPAAARDVKRLLETKPGLVLSARNVAGTWPVPSGEPGGHVNMLMYAFDPHPDAVLEVYERDGHLCASGWDAGKEDPLGPGAHLKWTLCAR